MEARSMSTGLEILKRDIKDWYKGVLAAALMLLLLNVVFGQVCPMVLFCGLPCPGCGITRSLFCFFTGHFREAFMMNPCVYPFLAYVAAVGFYRYVIKKQMKFNNICVMLLVLISTVVYAYRMLMWFPDREPMVYYSRNALTVLREIWSLR